MSGHDRAESLLVRHHSMGQHADLFHAQMQGYLRSLLR